MLKKFRLTSNIVIHQFDIKWHKDSLIRQMDKYELRLFQKIVAAYTFLPNVWQNTPRYKEPSLNKRGVFLIKKNCNLTVT